jgi:hypothetical protein
VLKKHDLRTEHRPLFQYIHRLPVKAADKVPFSAPKPLPLAEPRPTKRSAGNPIGEYDFGWMWRELGVEALRQ